MNLIDRHYFRLCRMYMGEGWLGRNWNACGPDASGIRAYDKWRKWAGKEPVSFERRVGWQSGYGRFEDRIQALGSPMNEGAILRSQAA